VKGALALSATVLLCAACGSSSQTEFRIFDPSGRVRVQVTGADILDGSVEASKTAVSAEFTNGGNAKFCALTRALARRGARLHRVQHFAIEVDRRVVSRPYIDYRAEPKGLCGPAFEIDVESAAEAQRIAHVLRSGS